MKHRLIGVVTALTTLLFALNAGATGNSSKSEQQPGISGSTTTQPVAPSSVKMSNEMVLNQLHHINQKEIEMAKLAEDNAQSPEVKNTAKKILSDHQSLESRVEQVAKAQDLKLEKFQPATFEKVTMDRLKDLKGNQFDQAFMRNILQGTRTAAEELRIARGEVQDPQIRSIVDQALPRIRQHEMAARAGQGSQSMGGTTGESSSDSSMGQSSSDSSMGQSSDTIREP